MIRNIAGKYPVNGAVGTHTGAYASSGETGNVGTYNLNISTIGSFSAARVVPTGAANKPRAWGALACAYLGQPAS